MKRLRLRAAGGTAGAGKRLQRYPDTPSDVKSPALGVRKIDSKKPVGVVA